MNSLDELDELLKNTHLNLLKIVRIMAKRQAELKEKVDWLERICYGQINGEDPLE